MRSKPSFFRIFAFWLARLESSLGFLCPPEIHSVAVCWSGDVVHTLSEDLWTDCRECTLSFTLLRRAFFKPYGHICLDIRNTYKCADIQDPFHPNCIDPKHQKCCVLFVVRSLPVPPFPSKRFRVHIGH